MEAARSLDVPGSEDGIRAARSALDAFGAAQGLPPGATWPFQVALDEVLSNIVKYGGRSRGKPARIELTLRLEGAELEMVVVDDAAPFNPLQAPVPDTAQPLEARSPGGLGIALLRRLMDVVEYDRVEAGNRLRVRRRLTSAGTA